MRVRKTAGLLVRPKGMTKFSKWPRGVLKDVFHLSSLGNTHQMICIA